MDAERVVMKSIAPSRTAILRVTCVNPSTVIYTVGLKPTVKFPITSAGKKFLIIIIIPLLMQLNYYKNTW